MMIRLLSRRSFVALITFLLTLSLLFGCVTERIGDPIPEPSTKDAAELNLQLGAGYLRQNDLRRAQGKLEKAVDQDPSLVAAHTVLGLVYERLGDDAAAERSYRTAVALGPRNPDALNSLGVYLCQTTSGRPEALDTFDRALAVPLSQEFSNKAMVNTNAGVCAKAINLPLAEDYLRAALSSDPRFGNALVQLADVSYKRGNYLQSRAFLERYMNQAEVSPPVLWLAMQVETAMGDAQAADEFGRRLKRDFPRSVEARMLMERERDAGT